MRNKGALERLQKRINSKHGNMRTVRRSRLSSQPRSARERWEPARPAPRRPRRRQNWLSVLFVSSVVFFLIAAAFALFLFFSGNNTVSVRNVDVAISGPTEVRAGEALSLSVVVTNRNAVPMELTDLVVEFPAGTRSETDVTVELPRIRESLGTIQPGESVNRTVRAVVFGQADTDTTIDASVEYRVPGSSAIFVSEESYTLPISQSPASITVEALQEVVSGQETAFAITTTSNVADVLSGMLLVAEYPPGFSFASASPAPSEGNNTWRLGDIEQGGKRTITVRGTFSGEDGAERVVRLTVGTENKDIPGTIAAPLATGDVVVALAKPFVSLSLSLDGSIATEHISTRGTSVRGDIRWTNNLPTRVQDVEITVKLSGDVLNRVSVRAERGFWRSSDNTLIWSRETDASLADVAPGASGVFSFTFAPRSVEDGTFRNPEIALEASVSARRITESQVPETLQSATNARVLIATDLALVSAVSHTGGALPPKADTESTYTVFWNATNSSNALANGSASAILPSYVRFVTGLSSDISYNPIGGAVTWDIGDMDAGDSKTASFQVAITPSLSQVGSQPTLVSDQRIFGFDRFTRQQLERTALPLTTGTGVSSQEGTVVQ
ncbi:MAG: hypothetical protein ACE5F4_01855 [Candidatus Paceibacteria bacterium]